MGEEEVFCTALECLTLESAPFLCFQSVSAVAVPGFCGFAPNSVSFLLWYIRYYEVLQSVVFKSELESASALSEQKGGFFQRAGIRYF